jgi:hypothetical protein
MDIDIVLGVTMKYPRVSNKIHVTNEKSLTLTVK